MPQGTIKQPLGYIPIMVKSKLCNLYGFSPQDLLQHHEEEEVTGILWVRKVCVSPEQSVRSSPLCRAWSFIFCFKFDFPLSLNAPCLQWLHEAAWELCSHGCCWIQRSVWCQYLQLWYRTCQLLPSNWGYCEGNSVERKIWRTGIERDIFISNCLLQLFSCLPSGMLAVYSWIQNYLVLHFALMKKERANYKSKSEK